MKAIVISRSETLAAQIRQVLSGGEGDWQVISAASVPETAAEIDSQSVIVLDCDCESPAAEPVLRELLSRQGFSDAPVLLVGSKPIEGKLREWVRLGAAGYVLRPLAERAIRTGIVEAMKPVGSQSQLDVKLINPFIEAAAEVLRTSAGTEVQRKDLFLKKNYRMFGDISGVMGLAGEASGSVVISMPAQLACRVVGGMLNEPPPPEVDEAVRDAIGEIVNMIAGRAKAALAGSEYHFTLSLPAVITGPGHEIAHRSGAPCIVVLFEAGEDELAIQVSLAPED